MVAVTEQAKQAYKTAIIGYLRERCKTDTYLAEACKKENKSLDGCIKYIVEQARKKAENNVAVIPDAEVFEWAVHYILEDSLNCESGKTDKKAKEKTAEKSVATDTNVATNDEDDEAEYLRYEDENSVGEIYKPAQKAKAAKKTIAEEAQLAFDF